MAKSIQTLLLFFIGVLLTPAQLFANESVIKSIESILPAGWELVETEEDVIPRGHYSGLEYNGQKGELALLM